MSSIPGANSDSYFGPTDSYDWRDEMDHEDYENRPDGELTAEERDAMTTILGIDPDEIFEDE